MASILEEDWLRAYSPNGKAVDAHKMPPMVYQIARVFFYNGWTMGAGRAMAAGRMLDETSQMLAVFAIMDCIEKDHEFLGRPKEELKGPDNPNDTLPSIQ